MMIRSFRPTRRIRRKMRRRPCWSSSARSPLQDSVPLRTIPVLRFPFFRPPWEISMHRTPSMRTIRWMRWNRSNPRTQSRRRIPSSRCSFAPGAPPQTVPLRTAPGLLPLRSAKPSLLPLPLTAGAHRCIGTGRRGWTGHAENAGQRRRGGCPVRGKVLKFRQFFRVQFKFRAGQLDLVRLFLFHRIHLPSTDSSAVDGAPFPSASANV